MQQRSDFFIMDSIKTQRALGLMSSSSLEGVNVAVISTDGIDVYDFGPSFKVPYDDALRERLRSLLGKRPDGEAAEEIAAAERELTAFNAEIVRDVISAYDEKIDVIGFHGLTLLHQPAEHYTCQIGDGDMLAELTGIKVVNRFRNTDVAAGGQGAPLSPVYHAALAAKFEKPVCFVNIGGISSLTWIGSNGELLAFDTGPGNAAVDDWVLKHGGMHMDYNGKLAITGAIDGHVLASLMRHKYFGLYPPKSVDRNLFQDKLEHLEALSLADGAATATAFVAESIAYSLAMYVPEAPKEVIICGGGACNPTLLRFLRQRLEHIDVKTAEEAGWKSNALEPQAFAFMAVRRLNMLPASFPATTGVPEPLICGQIHEPPAAM